MTVAIASGKGGTGKTTVAVNIAHMLRRPTVLLDCDVDEPNARLFFDGADAVEEIVTAPVPRVNEALCGGCGECARFCRFGAIAVVAGRPLVLPELCHGCGGCAFVCPRRAISEIDRRIGVVRSSRNGHIALVDGLLDVGATAAPTLIARVRSEAGVGLPIIIDAPPGASCPAVAAVRDANCALLVAEPTPFGLQDLEIAVELVRELGVPFGVVVNRVGIGDRRVHDFCRAADVPLLAEIPDDRRIAETCSRGEIVVANLPHYAAIFLRIAAATGLSP